MRLIVRILRYIIIFILGSFTGKQQGGLQSLFSAVGGSVGGVENKASQSGMDPALIQGVLSMLSGGAGGAAGAGGGSGFNLGSLIHGMCFSFV